MSSESQKYTESKRERFGINELTRRYENGDIEVCLEEFNWSKRQYIICHRTVTHPDGSCEEYNFEGIKSFERLVDGTVQQFNQDGNIYSEKLPDGSERWYYDNGKLCGEVKANGEWYLYYEDGTLRRVENPAVQHTIHYAKNGRINFEVKGKQIYINPQYYSYYKIGIKTDTVTEHWVENKQFNPHKKTLICLGGSATNNSRAANGNINAALDALNYSAEECENIQLAACYRPSAPSSLELAIDKAGLDRKQLKIEDYTKEIQHIFLPFVADKQGEKLKPLSEKELLARFRNIMFFTHCRGSDDLPIIEKTLKNMMAEIGYGELIQKFALRQILCMTNNSQREFFDKSDMTTIHRYSVFDGQKSGLYNPKTSADYGSFLHKHQPFNKYEGKMSGIINLRKNEILMVFDRVTRKGNDEHNYGFFTPENYRLTNVGRWQAKLMMNIGKYWLNNKKTLPEAREIIMICSANDEILRKTVEKAFVVGRQTQRAKVSVLKNPCILSAAYEKFKHNYIVPDLKGIYKLLSEKVR